MRSRRILRVVALIVALIGASAVSVALWSAARAADRTGQRRQYRRRAPPRPPGPISAQRSPQYAPTRLMIPSIHLDVEIIGVGVTSAGAMDAPRCNTNSDPICNEVYWFNGGYLPGETRQRGDRRACQPSRSLTRAILESPSGAARRYDHRPADNWPGADLRRHLRHLDFGLCAWQRRYDAWRGLRPIRHPQPQPADMHRRLGWPYLRSPSLCAGAIAGAKPLPTAVATATTKRREAASASRHMRWLSLSRANLRLEDHPGRRRRHSRYALHRADQRR